MKHERHQQRQPITAGTQRSPEDRQEELDLLSPPPRMSTTKQMWFVPDSGLDPELCEVDDSRSIIAKMHKNQTGQEAAWVIKHQRLGMVGWSLFFSEQDALDMQIRNCESLIRDRQRKLGRLREKRMLRRGCTPLCDPDAPTPHHQCKCCEGTTAESCTCHVEVGESTPVSV